MLNIVLLSLYGALLLAIALASLKYGKTMENLLVAGRSQKKLLITVSMLASTIGGGITIGTIERGSSMGFAAFWFVFAGAVAHFAQGALLSRKVRESEALTMAELAYKASGPLARLLVSIIIVITWTGISAAQSLALAKVLANLTPLSLEAGILVGAAFVIIYTLIGGQKSVLRTDLFQFGFLALGLVLSLVWLYIAKTPTESLDIHLFSPKFTPLDLVYQVIVMGGSYFICPMMFSRLLSADSPANARRSSFLSGTGMVFFAFALTFIGLWIRATHFETPAGEALYALAGGALHPALGIMLIFGLLAAIVSTADTVLLTAASVLQNDIIKKPSVAAVRVWVAVIGIAAAFIAFQHRDIIALLMKTYNGYTAGLVPALFVAIMYARFEGGVSTRKPNPLLFALAIVIGYLLGLAGSFASGPVLPKLLPICGMAVSLFLSLASWKFSPYKEKGSIQ